MRYCLIEFFLLSIIVLIVAKESGSAKQHSSDSIKVSNDIKTKQKPNTNTEDKLKELLTGDRTAYQNLPIQYLPIISIPQDTWLQTQLSKSEIYDSKTKYPPKHSFNYLIGNIDDIEVIINENDAIATEQFITNFKNELHSTTIPDRFYQLLLEMGGKSNLTRADFDTDQIDINGFGSDYYYANPDEGDRASTGMHGEYFLRAQTCANLKNCNVYPYFRVVHKSKSSSTDHTFSCHDIMTQLLPQIYNCMDKYGPKECPLLLTHGYFRDVWKVKSPHNNQYVVLKMMRPKKYDDHARDLQRNIRESIILYYLEQEEQEYMNKYGAKFTSFGETRAFHFVRELGHCIYPTYMSVTPYYNLTFEQFIKSGAAASTSIRRLIEMALDIAKATQVLHNIRGGPFHHTDIAIDQFMIDDNGNVLINDFNRGKFQLYRFPDDFKHGEYENIIKCSTYCAYESDGRNRAPEELRTEAVHESIDVYSTAMTIWSLFSGTRLWTKPYTVDKVYNEDGIESSSSGESFSYKEIRYLVHDTVRRPIMPYNMPYALKELIRWAIVHDPKKRPSANEFRYGIEEILKNLGKYTRNRGNVISRVAREKKLFKDHTHPGVPHNFPKCCRQ